MRSVKRITGICVVVFLVLNVIAAFHAWKFTHFYPPALFDNKRPEQMSALEKTKMILLGVRLSKSVINNWPHTPYETVLLHTADGLKIEAWLIPATAAKGTVILFHGYGGNKGRHLAEAGYFHELGYNTLLADFRAHGNSDGLTCSVGYKEAEEVKLAYDHVRKLGEKHIILWGMSMGAAAILKAIPEYGLQPDKVILESPFATLTDAVKSRMRAVNVPGTPISQLLTFWGGVEQGFWGPGFKPENYAQQLHMPVLVCWGKKDIRVTAQETDRLYRQLGSDHKQLLVFTLSGHQSFCRNEDEKWKRNVRHFLTGNQ